MKAFADLYCSLDDTTSTNRKIDALVDYFRRAPEEDAVWAVSFLIGRKPRRLVPARKLLQWAAELAEVPEWLFEASYDVVGDLAETITLLLPRASESSDRHLHIWVEQHLLPKRFTQVFCGEIIHRRLRINSVYGLSVTKLKAPGSTSRLSLSSMFQVSCNCRR